MDARLAVADGTVDLRRGLVHRAGAVVALTTKERELLAFLAERADSAVSRDDLQREVWGWRDNVLSRTIDTTVRRLRAKIEVDPANPVHLVTVHGTGYRFMPPVVAPPAPAPPAALPSVPFFGR